jgi:hypothetical protein
VTAVSFYVQAGNVFVFVLDTHLFVSKSALVSLYGQFPINRSLAILPFLLPQLYRPMAIATKWQEYCSMSPLLIRDGRKEQHLCRFRISYLSALPEPHSSFCSAVHQLKIRGKGEPPCSLESINTFYSKLPKQNVTQESILGRGQQQTASSFQRSSNTILQTQL